VPIIIKVAVNDTHLETIRIGRMSTGGRRPDEVNTYAVVASDEVPTMEEWMKAPTLTHRYGDGARLLVAKAFEVLEKEGS
jgi:hypothetical protein